SGVGRIRIRAHPELCLIVVCKIEAMAPRHARSEEPGHSATVIVPWLVLRAGEVTRLRLTPIGKMTIRRGIGPVREFGIARQIGDERAVDLLIEVHLDEARSDDP